VGSLRTAFSKNWDRRISFCVSKTKKFFKGALGNNTIFEGFFPKYLHFLRGFFFSLGGQMNPGRSADRAVVELIFIKKKLKLFV
jgi:hypothetical protein